MININGELITESNALLSYNNRGFKYGDAIFETISVENDQVIFLEDHYFRLMASMRMLRMHIPMSLTLEFFEKEVLKTAQGHTSQHPYKRVRLTVYRKNGGLYAPKNNKVDYLIEVSDNIYEVKASYSIDVFKDFYNYSGLLSTVKTTNRMINVLGSIYQQENNIDNCVLLNENKVVSEMINANVFIIKDKVVKTPKLSDGCIKGIVRGKIIELLKNTPEYMMEEVSLSPFEIQKADEVFITNTVIGVQPITAYKKRSFKTEDSFKIRNLFLALKK